MLPCYIRRIDTLRHIKICGNAYIEGDINISGCVVTSCIKELLPSGITVTASNLNLSGNLTTGFAGPGATVQLCVSGGDITVGNPDKTYINFQANNSNVGVISIRDVSYGMFMFSQSFYPAGSTQQDGEIYYGTRVGDINAPFLRWTPDRFRVINTDIVTTMVDISDSITLRAIDPSNGSVTIMNDLVIRQQGTVVTDTAPTYWTLYNGTKSGGGLYPDYLQLYQYISNPSDSGTGTGNVFDVYAPTITVGATTPRLPRIPVFRTNNSVPLLNSWGPGWQGQVQLPSPGIANPNIPNGSEFRISLIGGTAAAFAAGIIPPIFSVNPGVGISITGGTPGAIYAYETLLA